MSDERQKTVDDILAKMRSDGTTGPSDALDWVKAKLKYYADQIEAAVKREKDDVDREAHWRGANAVIEAVKKLDCVPRDEIGDALKIREALEAAKKFVDEVGKAALSGEIDTMTICQCAANLSGRIESALAAPPRNCDYHLTPKEAERAFVAETGSKSIRTRSVRWLYAAHSPSSAATLASPSVPTPGKETSKHDKIY